MQLINLLMSIQHAAASVSDSEDPARLHVWIRNALARFIRTLLFHYRGRLILSKKSPTNEKRE